MSEILQAVFRLLSIFIVYPWLAAVIGVLFATLGWKAGRWGVVTTGAVWVLYAGYETGMQQRWLCTGECNIRVDLLLIFPLLLICSIGAAWSLGHASRTRRPRPRPEGRR
jgi:formate hydrogenlyase subunit 3/multisubunit Na+/H+ antiporter MnhD subunit